LDDVLKQRALAARAEIEAGSLRGAALMERLLAVPPRDRDAWVDELLDIPALPFDEAELPRGAVPYLPSGVEEILTLMRDAPIGPADELVDLGSGLGRVVLLAHLLSGARASGVEIQAPLVHAARSRAAALGLPEVSFVHANAAEIELEGSVFFLYSPFNGEMLERVLARLESVARRRSIVVCAVQLELVHVAWLAPREASSASVTLYDSRPRST
jgi:hypothetical protein